MSKVSRDVLVGFVEEVNGYFPVMAEGIASFQPDSKDKSGLEEAHRHAHTIKGASSMLGFAGLSHIAYYVEEILDNIMVGKHKMDENTQEFLFLSLGHVEKYLNDLVDGSLEERPLVEEATLAYRRLQGLPKKGDKEAIREILGMADAVDKPAATPEPAKKPAVQEQAPIEPVLEPVDPPLQAFDMDEFAAELMEAFSEEAEDHISTTYRLLGRLKKQPDDDEAISELRRAVHTLKGAAATVGVPHIAGLSHRMEDMLDRLESGLSDAEMDLLFDSADTLTDQLEQKDTTAQLAELYARYDELLGDNGANIVEVAPVDIVDLSEYAGKDEAGPAKPAAAPRPTGDAVRVPLERIDELIRLTSEYIISRNSFEQRLGELTNVVVEFRPSLERLSRLANQFEVEYNVRHISAGGKETPFQQRFSAGQPNGENGVLPTDADENVDNIANEFDPLEFDRYNEMHILSRELLETTSDIRTVHNELRTLMGDFDSLLTSQGRVASEVQDKLMHARMVPLSSVITRLHRAVRVVASKTGKEVELEVIGEELGLDKQVLEEIVDPLLHALRNAVDHGLESTEARIAAGKPEVGNIKLHAFQEGNQIVMRITDDGAGIDLEKLRAKAVSGGFASEAEAQDLSKDALYSLLFTSGFSTASAVTDISGRGVGLDVVKTAVDKLKGTVSVQSTAGVGTMFTIRLPMTLAVVRALLVDANRQTFAIPLLAVSQILRMEREAVTTIGKKPMLRVDDKLVPLVRLAELLGLPGESDSSARRLPVLVLSVGNKQIALVVDNLSEGRDIVIKTLGNHLRKVRAVSGATLMGDGGVVLILDPAQLLIDEDEFQARTWNMGTGKVAAKRTQLTIMVVDDSLSVRRVVSNLVKNAGWIPVQARDGLEALEYIQGAAQLPDAILLDVEMPRMNGYELTSTLKAQPEYKDVPIIMLTSRSSDKHRRKAFEVGVSEYLIKPYEEETLLSAVRKLTQERVAG